MRSYKLIIFMNIIAMVMCHQKKHDKSHKPDQHMVHNSMHDVDHIVEHLKEKINIKKDLTNEELEFYYFLEHDFNNDSRLDGLEIFSAIKHSDLATELELNEKNITGKELTDLYNKEIDSYADLIDEIMSEDDLNKDGYLSYLEYVIARRRDAREEKEKSKSKP